MHTLGEIKLFPYDDVPTGYLKCYGQSLRIKDYPKLYMMIGLKYGCLEEGYFALPNLTEKTPEGMMYCIAIEGEIPNV